jgi:hypothetical protein
MFAIFSRAREQKAQKISFHLHMQNAPAARMLKHFIFRDWIALKSPTCALSQPDSREAAGRAFSRHTSEPSSVCG